MTNKAHWLLCIGLVSLSATATLTSDSWDGHYRLTWVKGPAADAQTPDMVFSIVRVLDADPANLAIEEQKAGLARWTLSVGEKNTVKLRPFPPRDYERLNVEGGGSIECLAGSRIFFCRVTPGTTVNFGSEGGYQEKIVARTGFFGFVLHEGGFELTKLEMNKQPHQP